MREERSRRERSVLGSSALGIPRPRAPVKELALSMLSTLGSHDLHVRLQSQSSLFGTSMMFYLGGLSSAIKERSPLLCIQIGKV